MNHEMNQQECMENCRECSEMCYRTALNHCLSMGGRHVEAEHFKLMLECAKICETSAWFQVSSSSFSHRLCSVCAEICEACAASCEKVGDMEACVDMCRRCAESCRAMAA